MRVDYAQVQKLRELIVLMANDSHFKDYANCLVDIREDLIRQAYQQENLDKPIIQGQLIHTVGVLDEIIEPIEDVFSQKFNE